LSESKQAMNTIRAYASESAHVIYGTAYDEALGDEIRVTVVATGLSRQGAARRPTLVQQPMLRTGTDNMPFQMGGQDAIATSPMTTSAMGNDYGRLNTPSVWRTRDRSQAAAKVDALASGGMDDFEIPAFLRKQAD